MTNTCNCGNDISIYRVVYPCLHTQCHRCSNKNISNAIDNSPIGRPPLLTCQQCDADLSNWYANFKEEAHYDGNFERKQWGVGDVIHALDVYCLVDKITDSRVYYRQLISSDLRYDSITMRKKYCVSHLSPKRQWLDKYTVEHEEDVDVLTKGIRYFHVDIMTPIRRQHLVNDE